MAGAPAAKPGGLLEHLKNEMDVRRKLFISRGGPTDLKHDCVVAQDTAYDIEKSIFSVLGEDVKQLVRAEAVKPYWSDAAVARAARDFARVPPPPAERQELLEFLATECDFKLEHADGSFMDHLTFCRDYCAAHYKAASATPLFIHSILGVGTNIFPMAKEKIPRLASLLTADDFAHVQAFPSILRIVQDRSLLGALRAAAGRLPRLRGVRFHRLIDNAPIRLTAAQLWVQLNFQLIHTIDFLPIADWRAQAPKLFSFADLHTLLTDAGKLEVDVDIDLSAFGGDGVSETLRRIVAGTQPETLQARQFLAAFVAERSRAIGHSLAFELEWAAPSRL